MSAGGDRRLSRRARRRRDSTFWRRSRRARPASASGGEPEKLGAAVDAWIGVLLAEFAARGVGSALYEGLSDWGRAVRARAPRGLRGRDEDGGPRVGSPARLRGGGPRHLARPRSSGSSAGRAQSPPEGLEIVIWADRPELAPGIYAVACEAYPDVPGRDADEMKSFEEWLTLDMGGPDDRPEAVFLALAADDVVGYSKLHLSAARPTVAANDMTGVKRAWRRRGVAGALKRAQLAWAKENGYERLETANETRNAPSSGSTRAWATGRSPSGSCCAAH